MNVNESNSNNASIDQGMPYVIFKVGEQCFGFSAEVVREMFTLQSVTPVPNTPEYMRGLINLRGKIVNLIDLRKFIGLPSYSEEVSKQIESASSCLSVIDGWVSTWSEGIVDHEAFASTEMGQWVASLSSEHSQLKKHYAQLPQLGESLYRSIASDSSRRSDESSDTVVTLAKPVQQAVEGFKKQLNLIVDTLRCLETEMVIVFEIDSALSAITVDEVLAVETISSEAIEAESPAGVLKQARLDGRIARREKTQEIVVLTSPHAIQFEN